MEASLYFLIQCLYEIHSIPSRFNKISIREIIDTHLSKTYDVLSMGFLPGFMYLGKTDKTKME